jgi:hypothetical protein
MFRAAFYKSTHAGLPGVYNRLVRGWERGPYSHCELIFSDGVAASSSYMDGGVRFKEIEFDPAKWDFIELPAHLEHTARDWFIINQGRAYDIRGNIHFLFGFVPHSTDKWFCSESIAEALGFIESWRYGPNILHSVLSRSSTESLSTQPAPAGFFLNRHSR